MKKLVLVLVLFALIATGTAFADYPDGWGVGAVFNVGLYGTSSGALSLKVPSLPIFWGLNLWVSPDHFYIGATGDYYIIHRALFPQINLDWYLGVGGWLGFSNNTSRFVGRDYNWTNIGFGARLPIGLSWQPIDLLEVFISLSPSLGIGIDSEVKDGNTVHRKGGLYFPNWHLPLELGFRLWF